MRYHENETIQKVLLFTVVSVSATWTWIFIYLFIYFGIETRFRIAWLTVVTFASVSDKVFKRLLKLIWVNLTYFNKLKQNRRILSGGKMAK